MYVVLSTFTETGRTDIKNTADRLDRLAPVAEKLGVPVVVDFSGKNSNVMYETGIAHTLGKHVVPITQAMADVPFDLQPHRALVYLGNAEGIAAMKKELSKRLATLVQGHSWDDL